MAIAKAPSSNEINLSELWQKVTDSNTGQALSGVIEGVVDHLDNAGEAFSKFVHPTERKAFTKITELKIRPSLGDIRFGSESPSTDSLQPSTLGDYKTLNNLVESSEERGSIPSLARQSLTNLINNSQSLSEEQKAELVGRLEQIPDAPERISPTGSKETRTIDIEGLGEKIRADHQSILEKIIRQR